jgi:hypothetical protein
MTGPFLVSKCISFLRPGDRFLGYLMTEQVGLAVTVKCFYVSKIRFEFHQVQPPPPNKIEPLRVSANDDDHQKAINTSDNGRHWPKHVKALFHH